MVQEYFEMRGVTQEFCKPATPEQNAHIESYHSMIEKVVCQEYEFVDIKECRDTMNRFIQFYNLVFNKCRNQGLSRAAAKAAVYIPITNPDGEIPLH